MTADLRDHLQSVLGRAYLLEREIIGGGMSRLFLANDRSLGRTVVVKVLPPELAGEVSAARFQREIAVTAQFQHPHILPILAAGAGESLLYYVMPFVEGESLKQRLEREGRLPARDALRLLREIADALAYAHAHGVVHRDVKPANVLLAGNHAVLVDFGVAQAVAEAAFDGRITRTGNFVGTSTYMAPEQFTGEPSPDGRADVFSLGVVAYEVLTGKLPFAGTSAQQHLAARVVSTPRPLPELRPDVPPPVADLVARALATDPAARLGSAAEFRDGLDAALSSRAPRFRLGRRRAAALGVALAAVAAVAAALLWRGESRPAVDDDLVAVAPFDVLGPEMALWREGFVDVLSANLDGAGPLRTVPPSVVMRNWRGRPDIESAIALGHRTGARFVVVGRVLGAGADSARVGASLVDVVTRKKTDEVELRDATVRMDRVADSLTVGLLRRIGSTRPVSAVRRASIGSTSLPALRAFLEGEQYFRRTAWDSARTSYERAIALDSTFAVAHAHMGLTYAWQRIGMDSAARVHALRAGALNHGLAPRESLLIVADSLRSVAYGYARDAAYATHTRRLFATLLEATRRYGQDAEAWYRLGDARFHFGVGPRFSTTETEILQTFDRALALDSAFAPAYIHPVELGFARRDPSLALRYARAYFALRPTDVSAAGTMLAAQLLDPGQRDVTEAHATIDTASADLLFQAYSAARRAVDSGEAAVALLRLMASGRRADYAPLADPAFAYYRLALQLSYRGHLREAAVVPGANRGSVYAEIALAGGAAPADARAVFANWLRTDPRDPTFATPALAAAGAWWARERDTTSLAAWRRRANDAQRTSASPADSVLAHYQSAAATAYLALARGDTSGALRQFADMPTVLCPLCAVPRLSHAQLLAAGGQFLEASDILKDRPTVLPSAIDVMWALERARVAERLGDKATALASYELVARAWARGDDELAQAVAEAQRGVERLRQ